MVEQLCVAGEHAATSRTGDKPLLSVAPHVFSQTVPDLKVSITACYREKKEGKKEYARASEGDIQELNGTSQVTSCSLSTCPVAKESLLLLWKRLWLSTFNVIVHMSVEPLRIVKCALYKDRS